MMNNTEELERALEYPWERWSIFLHPVQRQLVKSERGRRKDIDIQKIHFTALPVGDILQYNPLPAASRNELSESLYHNRLFLHDSMHGKQGYLKDIQKLDIFRLLDLDIRDKQKLDEYCQ